MHLLTYLLTYLFRYLLPAVPASVWVTSLPNVDCLYLLHISFNVTSLAVILDMLLDRVEYSILIIGSLTST